MVEAGPDGQARVVTHDYHYGVSDEWIQERVDEEGVEPPKVWRMSFDLPDLPNSTLRRKARALREIWEALPDNLELPQPTEDPEAFLELLGDWVEEAQVATAEQARMRTVEQSQKRQQVQAFETAMDAWIEEHGSQRLRLARERGYKVTSSYAKERAERELPETWVDTADRAAWRERVDPSYAALRFESAVVNWMEERDMPYSCVIVWLIEPPSSMAEALERESEDDPLGKDFEQQEAILISGYLDRYNVFLPVDPDERAPGS